MNEQVMLENALREQARKDVVNQIAQEYIANGLAKSLAVRNTRPQFVTASDKSPLANAAKDAYETALKDRTIKQEAIAFNQQMAKAQFDENVRQFNKTADLKETQLEAQLAGLIGGNSGSGGSNGNLTVEEADTVKNHTEKVENPNLRTLDGTLSTLNSVSTSGRWEKDKDGKYVAKPDSLWGEIGNKSILAFSPVMPLWGLSKLTSGDNFLKGYTKAASNYLTTPEVRNAISNLSPKEVDALMQKIENTIASKADGLAWYQNSYKTSDGKSLSSQEIVQRDLVPILTEFLKGSLDSKVVQAKHGLKVGNNKQNIR